MDMKKFLLLCIVSSFLLSCNKSSPPKEVAKNFIEVVYAADYTTAAGMATAETKGLVNQQKSEVKPSSTSEESFALSNLTETITNNTAEVKNENIFLSLKKENDGWKVVADEATIAAIKNRENNLLARKAAWEKLLKEYEARLQVAKSYVQYKKDAGTLSPQLQKLDDVINSLTVKTEWNKETIALYRQKQNQLADLIDKSLEPSYAANSDLSMNYIIQLSHVKDRIKDGEGEYEMTAKK